MTGGGKMDKVTAEEIKTDLLDQLDRNGVVGKYFLDLVNQYVNLWETNQMLQSDIEERGILVEYQNGKDQWGHKKNESVEQQLKVNQQMIKILDYLNIKPSKQDGDADADEEM